MYVCNVTPFHIIKSSWFTPLLFNGNHKLQRYLYCVFSCSRFVAKYKLTGHLLCHIRSDAIYNKICPTPSNQKIRSKSRSLLGLKRFLEKREKSSNSITKSPRCNFFAFFAFSWVIVTVVQHTTKRENRREKTTERVQGQGSRQAEKTNCWNNR